MKRRVDELLPWKGLRVGRLWLDQGFGIEMHPSRPPAEKAAAVRLWHDFHYHDGSREGRFTPHEHPTLVPLFGLLGAHVERAVCDRNLDLTMTFDSGASIKAYQLDEGWEYDAPWWVGRSSD